MRVDVFSILPGLVTGFAAESLLGRAQERGLLDLRVLVDRLVLPQHDPRG